MDISRIGYATSYRPAQFGSGRTGTGGQESADDSSTTKALNSSTSGAPSSGTPSSGSAKAPGTALSEDEQKQVDKLKAIDTKVRQHEAAHQAAGGGVVGGASFTYTKGPDGRSYATGGEVPVSAPAARSPETAIQQAQQVKAAALAPADPSGQDLSVAASADASLAQARRELAAGKGSSTGQAGSSQTASSQTGATTGTDTPGRGEPTDPLASVGQGGGTAGTDAGSALPGSAPSGTGIGSSSDATQQAVGAVAAAIPALVTRGVAAYGAAARINAAPNYAAALFA